MWLDGDVFHRQLKSQSKHVHGIYSIKHKQISQLSSQKLRKASDTLTRILHKVDTMKLDDQKEDKKNRNGIDNIRSIKTDFIKVNIIEHIKIYIKTMLV